MDDSLQLPEQPPSLNWKVQLDYKPPPYLFQQGKLAGSGGTVKVYSQQAGKHWWRWSAKAVHLLVARMLACPSQSKSLGELTPLVQKHPVKSFKGWSHSEGRLIHNTNNKKAFFQPKPIPRSASLGSHTHSPATELMKKQRLETNCNTCFSQLKQRCIWVSATELPFGNKK